MIVIIEFACMACASKNVRRACAPFDAREQNAGARKLTGVVWTQMKRVRQHKQFSVFVSQLREHLKDRREVDLDRALKPFPRFASRWQRGAFCWLALAELQMVLEQWLRKPAYH